IERLAKDGMHVTGPYPADTLFTKRVLEGCDAVLAMFHDQGLPVLKHAAFGDAVNVTLGLPWFAPPSTTAPRSTAPGRAKSMQAASGRRSASRSSSRALPPEPPCSRKPRSASASTSS